MRIVVQRVSEASVKIEDRIVGSISKGLMVLVGVETTDSQSDADYLVQKLVNLRIFNDEEGKMNLSIQDVSGELLIISQFTLHASTKKGNRPSYIRAARPEQAIPLYQYFIEQAQNQMKTKIQTGEFGADMKVSLVNEGPVTIILDSQNKDF
jgi:D-tyrosyl-tRNA(Tyr) deacylase